VAWAVAPASALATLQSEPVAVPPSPSARGGHAAPARPGVGMPPRWAPCALAARACGGRLRRVYRRARTAGGARRAPRRGRRVCRRADTMQRRPCRLPRNRHMRPPWPAHPDQPLPHSTSSRHAVRGWCRWRAGA